MTEISGGEVAQVIAPRINIGRWCAGLAVVMWYGAEAGAWSFVVHLPGGRVLGILYLVLNFGLAIRAGNDLLMWLVAASKALEEKRKFEAMGMKAAVRWAWEKEMHDALTLPVDQLKKDARFKPSNEWVEKALGSASE
jgi:hypothetical protein